MEQMQTQLNKTNKNSGNDNNTNYGNKRKRYNFGENYTAGLMVHVITRRVVASPRKKATNRM